MKRAIAASAASGSSANNFFRPLFFALVCLYFCDQTKTNTMETKFKVGDRVSDADYGNGTILHFDDKDRMYVVDFDVSHPALNDCNGYAHSGNGLYIDEVHLTLIDSVEQSFERMRKEMLNTPLTFTPTAAPTPDRAMIAAKLLRTFVKKYSILNAEDAAKKSVEFTDALIAELERPKQ